MSGAVVAGSMAAVCTVPAAVGSVTFPAALLSQLPATSRAGAVLELDPSVKNLSSFSVPRGGSVDGRGVATFLYSETILVDLR